MAQSKLFYQEKKRCCLIDQESTQLSLTHPLLIILLFMFRKLPTLCHVFLTLMIYWHRAAGVFEFIDDGSHGHLFGSCTVSKHPSVRDTFPTYYSSNHVVSRSETAGLPVFLQKTCFHRVLVKGSSSIRQRGWALTPRAVYNQHSVAAETPGDAMKPDMTQRHLPPCLMAEC